jgi:hypothetical protein
MKRYIWNLLILLDQGINVIFGPLLNIILRPITARFGDPDETLSSVMGKNVQDNECVGCKLICKILNKIQAKHCVISIEADRGLNAD